MVVYAVYSELVSGRVSLFYRERTGKFALSEGHQAKLALMSAAFLEA
jgi:hypothetical protein